MVRDGASRLLTMRDRYSLLHQHVHMLYRIGKVFLEFLHYRTGRLYAVDQADALADKIRHEITRLRISRGGRPVDRVEGVAADDALQRHRQRAGTVRPAVPRVGP